MNELWDMNGEYTVRSKDHKYKVNVSYFDYWDQNGVNIEVKDKEDNCLHIFSICLERRNVEEREIENVQNHDSA